MIEGIIYKFTNKINGKIYIGQTIHPKKRYNEHKRVAEDSVFHRAIKKYGFENFDYEVIFSGDESTLDKKEIYYIALYNSNDNRFGYNISNGGEAFMRGKHMPQEAKDKISKANKGKSNPMKGKHLSIKTKELMSMNHADFNGKNHPQYHKGKLFEYEHQIYSIPELSKLINCRYNTFLFHIKRGETEFKVKGHQIKFLQNERS